MKKKKKETLKQYSGLQMQTAKQQQPRRKKSDPLKTRGINYIDF